MRKIRTKSIRERRRKLFWDMVALWAALGGAVLLLLSQLSMLPVMRVQGVEVMGNEVIATKALGEIAQSQVTGYYGKLFARSHMLLYPRREIELAVADAFPRVAEVDVSLRGVVRPVLEVVVRERQAVGAWCMPSARRSTQIERGLTQIQEDPNPSETSGRVKAESRDPKAVSGETARARCFLVDEIGFVFAPYRSGDGVLVEYQEGGVHVEQPLRSSVLEEEIFRALRVFIEQVAASDMQVDKVMLVSEERYELELATGMRIIFDPMDGYDQVLEHLSLARGADEIKERFDELLYIDLRFGNKLFYKMKKDTVEE